METKKSSILNRSETYTYDERHNRLTKRIQAAGSDTTHYYTMYTEGQLIEPDGERPAKTKSNFYICRAEKFKPFKNGKKQSPTMLKKL